MQVILDDDDSSFFRILLSGPIRWNDRLALARLAAPLRLSAASGVLLDATDAFEADGGAFGGLAATTQRMAAAAGRTCRIVAPAAAGAAA
jgi:hypothetical protein